MRLSGYQPQYFPRLHYVARILRSDIFTISDYVQFVRAHRYPTADGGHERGKSYQADTPVKSSREVQFLTVPVQHGGLLPMNKTAIAYEKRWQEKHLKGIQMNYGSAKNFAVLFPQLTELLLKRYAHLAQLNIATILWALGWVLGMGQLPLEGVTLASINERLERHEAFPLRQIVLKSETPIAPPGRGRDATDWIIETCRMFGTDEYYCGGTATTAYIDAARFRAAGIRLTQQQWICQPYTQQFPKLGFIPNLSILDLLMNEDPERARAILSG